MSNVYDDVAELQTQVAALQSQVAQLQGTVTNINTKLNTYATDSGWLNLPLSTGIEAYATTQIPQYRKIGKTVFIRGALKNVLDKGVLATLPAGYRPNTTIAFPQVTSVRTGNFAMFARYTINSAGEIKLEAISDGADFGESKWFPISTCFSI